MIPPMPPWLDFTSIEITFFYQCSNIIAIIDPVIFIIFRASKKFYESGYGIPIQVKRNSSD
ncbi:hypothetical protein BpHYR1_012662 [Brachionus plicatilis]|uniref:Uncharacterized protein n=1 Tax=Brachionus plicatilis TaxID=10195 RepID=A0A3M7SUU1_BRAPC|nr:hypothetical protein BpHYR1_012662 [Brachionus plicatilis]